VRPFARLSPPAKIFDFDGSPRRAGSRGSPKRCFFVGEAAEKTDLIVFAAFVWLFLLP
jgi:hypothetical protein